MDPKFVVSLSGRDYPLYAGILAEAHERGLQSIETELIQIPTEENGQTAIVKAVVRMKGGESFEGYGDANPKNVNPRMVTAILRMAETRAKGRALRDAINCGQTMLEELPDLEDEKSARAPAPAPRRLTVVSSQGDGASTAACEIDGCGVILTPGQVKVSQANFDGRLLCPSHQRLAKVAR